MHANSIKKFNPKIKKWSGVYFLLFIFTGLLILNLYKTPSLTYWKIDYLFCFHLILVGHSHNSGNYTL